MTPQEIQLIQGVADRLRNANLTEKDAEAEALIKKEIGAQPDSTYVLTQAVILQEYALKQAQTQIDNLQKQVEKARTQGSSSQQPAGASFLGGLFDSGAQQPPSSAPSSSTPRPTAKPVRRDPWGSPATPSRGAAGAGGGFGSFMRSAGSIALGVAGGAMLANALQGMLAGEDSGAEQTADEGVLGDTGATSNETFADATDIGNEYDDPGLDPDATDDPNFDEDPDFGAGDLGDDDWS